jgi:hypothetical protein
MYYMSINSFVPVSDKIYLWFLVSNFNLQIVFPKIASRVETKISVFAFRENSLGKSDIRQKVLQNKPETLALLF